MREKRQLGHALSELDHQRIQAGEKVSGTGAKSPELLIDLRKIIVDYDVEIGGGRLTLNVSSAPIPSLGQSETK